MPGVVTSHAGPRTRPDPGAGSRTFEGFDGPAPVVTVPRGPLRSALGGAAAVLAAVAAMVAVSAVALWLLDAGESGSLWSLTMTVTAMAVGGSVSGGEEASGAGGSALDGLAGLFGGGGGGGMSPSMNGAADAVPLGVTLVGAVVLWLAFSRRLRDRRVDAREPAVRAAGAGVAALLAFVAVANLAHGTFTMPTSAMGGPGGGQDAGAGGPGGSGGLGGAEDPLGDLFGGGGLGGGLGDRFGGGLGGGLGGGAGTSSGSEMPPMALHVDVASTAWGALVWVALALAVGCVVSRRVRVPLGRVVDRLRPAWAPSLSAVVRTLLGLVAVPLALVTVVGVVVGGSAATAAGAALLLLPNALAVFLTLGGGTPWTADAEQVRSEGGNPLASLMEWLGTLGGREPRAAQPDRHARLTELSAGGWPLWLAALTVTAVVLTACAYAATRTTDPAHTPPLHRYRGRFAPHIGFAERFGIVTAVVFGLAAHCATASGRFGATMFGSEMGGMQAELHGNVPWAVGFGLLIGAAAGLAGSGLRGVRERRVAGVREHRVAGVRG